MYRFQKIGLCPSISFGHCFALICFPSWEICCSIQCRTDIAIHMLDFTLIVLAGFDCSTLRNSTCHKKIQVTYFLHLILLSTLFLPLLLFFPLQILETAFPTQASLRTSMRSSTEQGTGIFCVCICSFVAMHGQTERQVSVVFLVECVHGRNMARIISCHKDSLGTLLFYKSSLAVLKLEMLFVF